MNVDEAEKYISYAVNIANKAMPLNMARENEKALTVVKIALGKQKGKQTLLLSGNVYLCPYCGMENIVDYCPRYCGHCGQAVEIVKQEAQDGEKETRKGMF